MQHAALEDAITTTKTLIRDGWMPALAIHAAAQRHGLDTRELASAMSERSAEKRQHQAAAKRHQQQDSLLEDVRAFVGNYKRERLPHMRTRIMKDLLQRIERGLQERDA